jgi:glutamate-ammonia-ligase adenylyltransferase
MCVRPSGKGGLAFTQIGAFEDYQRREAWTWEHQALLHSRWVAGDAGLGAAFSRIRRAVLVEAVKRETLREEIVAMRERMRAEHGKPREGQFDLKQDRGGIADIEFLAQYWVLRHVREQPPLAEFADTIRHLESSARRRPPGHRPAGGFSRLPQAAHHLSLEQRPPVVDAA